MPSSERCQPIWVRVVAAAEIWFFIAIGFDGMSADVFGMAFAATLTNAVVGVFADTFDVGNFDVDALGFLAVVVGLAVDALGFLTVLGFSGVVSAVGDFSVSDFSVS